MTSPFDRRAQFFAICLGLLNSVALAKDAGTPASDKQLTVEHSKPVDFVRDIQPILRDNCYECHAGTTEEGNLNLGVKAKAFQGGDSDEAILVGNSEDSLMIDLVSGGKDNALMPPEGYEPLTAKQVGLLRAWIDQGAPWPEDADVVDPKMDRAKTHWAFQRLQKVNPPSRSLGDGWPKSPIDLFVQQRLDDAGLKPSQPADARTLVRRLYFDLIGLPPSRDQTNDFIAAHSEDSKAAVQNLVDQLLGSPRYGERWGRHWLDVARYADSDGQEADMDRPHAYRYRDFVIQAFNENMPYDQFVRWQIAGDEIEPEKDAAVSATGFLTAGTSFKLPDSFIESERLANRYNEMDDVISTLGSGMLGITVACARCHDHKYDAFSAKEYYQLLGVFHSGDRVSDKLPSGEEGYLFRDFDEEGGRSW
ncbi:DUF1549 domain-containing protein, partial [Rhodopirellula bahusiensis]|uniref:DUF1549 domain-containing protein n=1 Tax=Rhodopirellula bahusiensis TaxID=2014065 RepID=UPI003297473F